MGKMETDNGAVIVKKRKVTRVQSQYKRNVTAFFSSNVIMSCFVKFVSPMCFMRLLCSVPLFLRCRNKYMKELESQDLFDTRLLKCLCEYLGGDAIAAEIIIKQVKQKFGFFIGDIVSSTLHGFKTTNVDILYHWDIYMEMVPHQCVSKLVTQQPVNLYKSLIRELAGRCGENSGIHGSAALDFPFGERLISSRLWSRIYIGTASVIDLYEVCSIDTIRDILKQHPEVIVYSKNYLTTSVNKKT